VYAEDEKNAHAPKEEVKGGQLRKKRAKETV